MNLFVCYKQGDSQTATRLEVALEMLEAIAAANHKAKRRTFQA